VRIGLKQTAYSVSDSVEYQLVCVEVLSGSVAGREIEISYTTTGGEIKETHISKAFNVASALLS